MTLTRLLEIERRLLTDPDDLGLRFAESLWISAGSPVESSELCRAIEDILLACEREGVHYPAILLRRKKEVERGTWKPRPATAARPAVSTRAAVSAVRALPAPRNISAAPQVSAPPQVRFPQSAVAPTNSSQAVSACKLCGGSGIVKSADGQTGRACECFLRRWVRTPGLA